MSFAGALARANTLRVSLLDHGVATVSIELQQGRPGTPNDAWFDTRFVGDLQHHTVSRPAQGDTPCLALVKAGRVDVPGPLCNGYGGYDRVARIICMGWANHPGFGGPLSLPSGTIPADNGRPYLFGWEFEGGLEPWSDEMHEFMARCAAGTLDWLALDVRSQGEHLTWAPDRKIDRLHYTTQSGRDATAHWWTTQQPPAPPDEPTEDDMPTFLNVIIPPAPRDEAGVAQTDVNGRPLNATQIGLPKGGGTGGVKVGNIWLSVYASVSASTDPIRVWGERSGATDQPEQLWAGEWFKETRLRTRSDTSVELPDPTHGVTIAHDSPESVAVLIEIDKFG